MYNIVTFRSMTIASVMNLYKSHSNKSWLEVSPVYPGNVVVATWYTVDHWYMVHIRENFSEDYDTFAFY